MTARARIMASSLSSGRLAGQAIQSVEPVVEAGPVLPEIEELAPAVVSSLPRRLSGVGSVARMPVGESRIHQDLVAGLPEPGPVVDVLEIHEVALVEPAQRLEHRAPHEQEAPRGPVDRKGEMGTLFI